MLTFSQFLEHYSQILNEENFVLVTDQGVEEDTVKNFIREFVETPQITLKNNGLELTGKAKRKVYKDIDLSLDSPKITTDTVNVVNQIITKTINKMLSEPPQSIGKVDTDILYTPIDDNTDEFTLTFKVDFQTSSYKGDIEIVINGNIENQKSIEKSTLSLESNWVKRQ